MPEIGLFEAMYSARALRRLKPDPVPDEIITRVLDAAIRAFAGSWRRTNAVALEARADIVAAPRYLSPSAWGA